MDRHAVIDFEFARGAKSDAIARRVYIVEFPAALKDYSAEFFDIIERVRDFFGVPINDIRLGGSAQSGYSFHENRPFVLGQSDLDLAIVNTSLFEKYLRIVQARIVPDPESVPTPNQSLFPTRRGNSVYNQFLKKVAIEGALFPQLMPICPEVQDIIDFQNRLSEMYTRFFKDISVVFFLSCAFFEFRQRSNIGRYLNNGV